MKTVFDIQRQIMRDLKPIIEEGYQIIALPPEPLNNNKIKLRFAEGKISQTEKEIKQYFETIVNCTN